MFLGTLDDDWFSALVENCSSVLRKWRFYLSVVNLAEISSRLEVLQLQWPELGLTFAYWNLEAHLHTIRSIKVSELKRTMNLLELKWYRCMHTFDVPGGTSARVSIRKFSSCHRNLVIVIDDWKVWKRIIFHCDKVDDRDLRHPMQVHLARRKLCRIYPAHQETLHECRPRIRSLSYCSTDETLCTSKHRLKWCLKPRFSIQFMLKMAYSRMHLIRGLQQQQSQCTRLRVKALLTALYTACLTGLFTSPVTLKHRTPKEVPPVTVVWPSGEIHEQGNSV